MADRKGYADYRQPEPRIAALIVVALGDADGAQLGAGAGPTSRSTEYRGRARRRCAIAAATSARAIDATAEPLPDGGFDASMTTTRSINGRTCAGLGDAAGDDRTGAGPQLRPAGARSYWLNDYAPEVIAVETPAIHRSRRSALRSAAPPKCAMSIRSTAGTASTKPITAGERLLTGRAGLLGVELRRAPSARLGADLRGAWDQRHGALRNQPASMARCG